LGRGFSYAEVLFAVSILSVGILGTAGAMSTAALDVYQGGRETVAAQQSQALMERIRNAASYEDLLSYADAPPAGATAPRPDYVDDNRDAWVAAAQAAFPERNWRPARTRAPSAACFKASPPCRWVARRSRTPDTRACRSRRRHRRGPCRAGRAAGGSPCG